MILFLNNDYKGGELIFHGPKKGTEKIRTVNGISYVVPKEMK